MSRPRRARPPITVPEYLAAVQRLHGIGPGEIARALRVSPSVVGRWARGTLVPPWPRVRGMTALWGGDPALLALGAALQRWARATGATVEDGVRLLATGRRQPRAGGGVRGARRVDRRQLPLPMTR